MRPVSRHLPSSLTPIATAACLLMLSVPATAQQSSPSGVSGPSLTVQTIEVTARRRLETQFDVPASLTAIAGDKLQATGITSIQDIVALVPNATIAQSPDGTDTYISIRGMRQADVGAPANFGAYRNGIFAGGRRVNLGSQIDVARVEVVRGPQGGLYGREAVGGAVNVIYAMPKPGVPLGGYAAVAVENDSRIRLEGAVNAPIGADAAVRSSREATDPCRTTSLPIRANAVGMTTGRPSAPTTPTCATSAASSTASIVLRS